jgi:tRNA 2-selenouridine synthase
MEPRARPIPTSRSAGPLVLPAWRAGRATLPAGVPVVDLRSPAEYDEDHLPGAVNVPLFDDDERAIVGTLYRQVGQQEAFERGIDITVDKVRDLVAAVGGVLGRDLPEVDLAARVRAIAGRSVENLERSFDVAPHERLEPGTLLLHCWRGGMRSRSVAALLRELGWPVVLLDGGHKAYRAVVHAAVGTLEYPRATVLRGLTGVGKTLVLRALEALRPGLTVDLEGLADHRSSILGMVGKRPRSQKAFETGLVLRHERGYPFGHVVYEGESRKVGNIVLPERVWQSLGGARGIRLVAPLEVRVKVLLDDYLEHDANRAQLLVQLPFIEKRLGAAWDGELCRLLSSGREAELVETLLEHYYDPLYAHTERKLPCAIELDSSDPAACAAEIARCVAADVG